MNRIIICIATMVVASGALQASGIIACSGTATSSNSCITAQLLTFNNQVQWNTLSATNPSMQPTLNATSYATTWDASGSFVNLTVSGSSLIRADNYDYVYNSTYNIWGPATGSDPYKFTGNFDSAPDTGISTGIGMPVGAFGEGLLGSFMPGTTGTFVVGANSVLTSFGFRISSVLSSNFNVTINLFSSSNGSGTPLQTLTENGLSGGGNCSGLIATPTPQPCNTAPFLFISTTGAVKSFSISTNDTSGFYIDSLDFDTSVPEPASMLITGAGLLTLAYAIRRKRAPRSAARQ